MPEVTGQLVRALIAVVLGVGGAAAYFIGVDGLITRVLPDRVHNRVRPWVYLFPALAILAVYLVYPTVQTVYLSFLGPRSQEFVGLENYRFALTSGPMLIALRNNLLWLVFFTSLAVSMGLVLAVLLDKISYEPLAKSAIFMPMVISFVGAGVIWKFVYAFRPQGQPQIGLLNGVLVNALPGFEPIGWLIEKAINNFALIGVGVWIWTGFAMIILSAAIKGIPDEIIEAARVDGANEWQVFWRITVPMISSTIAVVATTLVINVLKIFDIVYVMTNGAFDTEVIANRMVKEMFSFNNFGRASAIAVVLLAAIIPVMLVNIRRFQQQEATR